MGLLETRSNRGLNFYRRFNNVIPDYLITANWGFEQRPRLPWWPTIDWHCLGELKSRLLVDYLDLDQLLKEGNFFQKTPLKVPKSGSSYIFTPKRFHF